MAASLAPLTHILAQSIFPDDLTIYNSRIQPRVAIMAACVVAIYPMLVIYRISLATENLFFVLALSSYLVLLKAKETIGRNIAFWKKLGLFASAGILLGMTCLTHSVAEIFAVFAVIWVWFFLKERCMAIVVLAAVGIAIFPWIVCNSLLYGRLTGIESALGYNLYVGYHPDGTGTFHHIFSSLQRIVST